MRLNFNHKFYLSNYIQSTFCSVSIQMGSIWWGKAGRSISLCIWQSWRHREQSQPFGYLVCACCMYMCVVFCMCVNVSMCVAWCVCGGWQHQVWNFPSWLFKIGHLSFSLLFFPFFFSLPHNIGEASCPTCFQESSSLCLPSPCRIVEITDAHTTCLVLHASRDFLMLTWQVGLP